MKHVVSRSTRDIRRHTRRDPRVAWHPIVRTSGATLQSRSGCIRPERFGEQVAVRCLTYRKQAPWVQLAARCLTNRDDDADGPLGRRASAQGQPGALQVGTIHDRGSPAGRDDAQQRTRGSR